MTPWVPVHSLAERDYLQFRRRAIFECDKWDPQARRYSTTKQVSSFAAVFPTTGGPQTKRYFVLILMDEPQRGHLGLDPTGGIAAAPAAGRVIERIAPFLGVKRQPAGVPQAIAVEEPPEDPDAAAER